MTGARAAGPENEFTTGGAPSWEPINLAAMSLLQDISLCGGLDQVESDLNTSSDPEAVHKLQRNVRVWRARCTLILGLGFAPYPLMWDRRDANGKIETVTIHCPVVDERGDCGGILRVHRDNDAGSADYGRPTIIICSVNDDHDWPAQYGWLRLGVLLGGIA